MTKSYFYTYPFAAASRMESAPGFMERPPFSIKLSPRSGRTIFRV